MDTQQRPANRLTVEEAKAIIEAINPGLEDEDDADYDLESDGWDEE